jgi:hypothetical protein
MRNLDVSNFVLFSRNTNKIDGANIAPLAHAPALRSLNLMGLNLHDADMAFVAQVKQLTTLNLIGNPITGQGCARCSRSITWSCCAPASPRATR